MWDTACGGISQHFRVFPCDAGNQPETIASENGRNIHVLLLLRGNSIVSTCGIDRSPAASSVAVRRRLAGDLPVSAHGGRMESCAHYIY
jgi:hypothetical protein